MKLHYKFLDLFKPDRWQYVTFFFFSKELPEERVNLQQFEKSIRDNTSFLFQAEAENLPYKEIFVKAVQSSERFMSKKFLGVNVTGKEFFSVRDEGKSDIPLYYD